jgi:hypothetical protein
MHAHLEPGGTLVVDIEVPYADADQWRYWTRDGRGLLPEARESAPTRRRASDGAEYGLGAHVVDVDPLGQRVTLAMHAERWRDGVLEAEEDHTLTIGLYFRNEVVQMLERAGFGDVVVEGDHNSLSATREDDFLVFVARKP